MKRLIFLLLFAVSGIVRFAQAGSDHPMPDSATVVSLPWYNNNQYLTDYLTNRGFYNSFGSDLRTSCPSYRYAIPVKLDVSLDNAVMNRRVSLT